MYKEEQEFLNDQRFKKKIAVCDIDITTTSAFRMADGRKSRKLQKIFKFNQERQKNTNVSEIVTANIDCAEEKKNSLPKEQN